MVKVLVVLLLPYSSSFVFIQASLVGDEVYQRVQGGVFWVFTSRGVSIVDPVTCRIDHSFDKDVLGQTLPLQWRKGAYMELPKKKNSSNSSNNNYIQKTAKAYVLINSGEAGEVIVMDTMRPLTRPAIQRIPVGTSLGNAFAVRHQNQYWAHSDDEGYYYVIALDTELSNPLEHTGHPIKAKMNVAHHSHLIWLNEDEDTDTNEEIGESEDVQVGYATSMGEAHLAILHMKQHKRLGTYDFSNHTIIGTCPGAASMAYSKINRHLYVECVAANGADNANVNANANAAGILEFDVSRPQAPLFIQQHVTVGGTLRETPDQMYVTATDKGTNTMHFFAPQKQGQPSQVPYNIRVPGHPTPPIFYENALMYDYVACMALTESTNRYHINPNLPQLEDANPDDQPDAVVCDYYNNCSPAKTQDDVDHGMCLYRNADGIEARGPLLTATRQDISQIKAMAQPFGQACNRCASGNYESDDDAGDVFDNPEQTCICTPKCGSCAGEDYPNKYEDPLLQSTGIRCLDVKDALLGLTRYADLIPGAGAVKQRPNKINDPSCGFDEPLRTSKRGADIYHASSSTIPEPAVVIVDMSRQTRHCSILLPGEPQEIIYVPTSFHYGSKFSLSASNGLSNGMIAMVVVTLVVVSIVLVVTLFVCGRLRYRHRHGQEFFDLRNEISVEMMTNGSPFHGPEESKREVGVEGEVEDVQDEDGLFVFPPEPTITSSSFPIASRMESMSSCNSSRVLNDDDNEDDIMVQPNGGHVADMKPTSGELA